MTVRVEGMEKVVKNLNKEIKGIKNRSIDGLLAAALIAQRESDKRVPVETGVLRASSFVRKTPEDDMSVELGYSANYALFVHENLEMKLKGQDRPSGLGKYWGPKGEAKFLENSLRDKKADMLKAIQRKARVKK